MKQNIEIKTEDNFSLPAFLAEPEGVVKGAILICTGLGIPKEFYEKYLLFLAKEGYVALVFDYRGIGDVKSKREVRLKDWALQDMPAAIDFLKRDYPKLPLHFFGHSIAGQMAGLIPNHYLIDRYFFFCSTGGHCTLFDFPLNLFSWFMNNLHLPITSRLFGYMPPSLTYRGVAIAKGLALDWAKWSRDKNYIAGLFGKEVKQEYYLDFNRRIDWIWFKDDPITTDRALSYMMSYYKNADIQKHIFDPKEMGLPRIGHSGFFASKAGEELWRFPLDLIERS